MKKNTKTVDNKQISKRLSGKERSLRGGLLTSTNYPSQITNSKTRSNTLLKPTSQINTKPNTNPLQIKTSLNSTSYSTIPLTVLATYITKSITKTMFDDYCKYIVTPNAKGYLEYIQSKQAKYLEIYNRGFFNSTTNTKVKFDEILNFDLNNYVISNQLDKRVILVSMIFPSEMRMSGNIRPVIENKNQSGGKRRKVKGGVSLRTWTKNSNTNSNASSVSTLNHDERRTVVSIKIHSFYDKVELNYGMYILKHSSNDENTLGYIHESFVYKCFEKQSEGNIDNEQFVKENVVTRYGSGYTIKKNELPKSDKLPISEKIVIPNMPEKSVYLLLANTFNYCDFENYIKQLFSDHHVKKPYFLNRVQNTYKNISKVIEFANIHFGYFHGDLHCGNVKVKSDNDILLFDFDFSGHINNPLCYRNSAQFNFEYYNLEKFVYEGKVKNLNSKTLLENKDFVNEKKMIMYVFDMFRLYMAMFINITILYEDTQPVYLHEFNKNSLYKTFNEHLIEVFRTQQTNVTWNEINQKSYKLFRRPAWNDGLQSYLVFNESLIKRYEKTKTSFWNMLFSF